MTHNAVVWFELPVLDIKRACSFYESVLGVALSKLPMDMEGFEMWVFPMEAGAPNAAGALIQGEDYVPSMSGTVLYFQCQDLLVELGRVEGAGGEIIMPKTDIGPYGSIALFKDTEGNRVGLHTAPGM